MNASNNTLSDEQIADLLASAPLTPGSSNQEDAELHALRAALGSYRSETLLWAERRSAVQPSLVAAAQRNRFWAAVPQWSLAAVAAVTVATGIVHFTGNPGDRSAAAPMPATASAPAQALHATQADADIAADNQLLSSIDQALTYRPVSPADEFGLKASSSQTKPRTHLEAED
jgi:hypothetical protein